ncbi:MAG: hypothetical protein ACNA7X_01175 [Dehalococcoidia bacterium]
MLRVASTILIVVALSSLVIGVVYVARGTLMGYHEEFIGMTIDDIASISPELANLAKVFIRLAGTLFIGVGVSLIAIIHYGIRQARRWAWWTALIAMGVVNVPLVAITQPVGGFPWMLAIAMLTLFVAGIALAARDVFAKPHRAA